MDIESGRSSPTEARRRGEEGSRAAAPEKEQQDAYFQHNEMLILLVIMILGMGASLAFLVLGILSTERDSQEEFTSCMAANQEELTEANQGSWQGWEYIDDHIVNDGSERSYTYTREIEWDRGQCKFQLDFRVYTDTENLSSHEFGMDCD